MRLPRLARRNLPCFTRNNVGSNCKHSSPMSFAGRSGPHWLLPLIFVAFGSLVLRLFGPGFEQGYATLLILTLGQLVNAFAGPVLSLLNMTGHQVVTARVLSTSAIFGVVFGLVFTRIWGSVGTAVAFSGAMVLWNAWLAIFVIRKLEIYPSLPMPTSLPARLPHQR